jgi:hypothetical protein
MIYVYGYEAPQPLAPMAGHSDLEFGVSFRPMAEGWPAPEALAVAEGARQK